MIYILAAIGAITVAVLMWRAFGPELAGARRGTAGGTPVAPDDDPEFLRRLAEEQRKQRGNGEQGT